MRQKTLTDVRQIVSRINFLDRKFVVVAKGDGFLLQMHYMEPDVISGKLEEQHTRKWYISSWATVSEVVQTVLKCVITSQEHIAREFFLYKGERVFGPHHNVEDLVELAKTHRLRDEFRQPKNISANDPES